MRTTAKAILIITSLLCLMTTSVRANGRKPIASVAVSAVIETKDGKTEKIFNVSVEGGAAPVFELNGTEGEAEVTLKLTKIESLKMVETPTADAESVRFEVKLRGAEAPRIYALRVVEAGKKLKFRGITEDSESFQIAIASCKAIAFSPQGKMQDEKEWPVRGEAKK